jgi:hypothetical protein
MFANHIACDIGTVGYSPNVCMLCVPIGRHIVLSVITLKIVQKCIDRLLSMARIGWHTGGTMSG